MITIGLTGSIGMGKSTVTAMLSEFGALTWSADDAVHRMYEKDGAAIAPLSEIFPDAITDGAVDRGKLAAIALASPDKLKKLEAIVHPLVAADRGDFIRAAAHAHAPAVVLDIPLLFENDAEQLFDVTIVVSAPADVQRERVLARPGMTEEKLTAILAQQMPDADKRARADYVIETNRPLEETRAAAAAAYAEIIERAQPRA